MWKRPSCPDTGRAPGKHPIGTLPQCGFTLIELLIAIAILGIVLSLGLPSLRDFVVSNRLTSDINSFVGLVNYARSEAITRNQSVVICPRNPTDNTCISSQFWNEYDTQAFVDVDGNNNRNSGDILLKTLPAIDPAGLQTSFARPTGSINKVIFGSLGFSQTPLRFDIHTVKAGDTDYEYKYGRSICISKPGRVRVVAYSASSCTDF